MAEYIDYKTFTMVATPHALQQSQKRAKKHICAFLSDNSLDIPRLFAVLTPDQCFAVPLGKFLVYMKRKYNSQRRRWELECISLTPSDYVHTRHKKFAKLLKNVPSSKKSTMRSKKQSAVKQPASKQVAIKKTTKK